MRRFLYTALLAELAILASAIVFGLAKTKNESFVGSWMTLVPLGVLYGLLIADKLSSWFDVKYKAKFPINRLLFVGLVAGFVAVNLPFVSGLRALDYDPRLDSARDVFRLLCLLDLWLGLFIGGVAIIVMTKVKK